MLALPLPLSYTRAQDQHDPHSKDKTHMKPSAYRQCGANAMDFPTMAKETLLSHPA